MSFVSKIYALKTLSGLNCLAGSSLHQIDLDIGYVGMCLPNFAANDKILPELLVVKFFLQNGGHNFVSTMPPVVFERKNKVKL